MTTLLEGVKEIKEDDEIGILHKEQQPAGTDSATDANNTSTYAEDVYSCSIDVKDTHTDAEDISTDAEVTSTDAEDTFTNVKNTCTNVEETTTVAKGTSTNAEDTFSGVKDAHSPTTSHRESEVAAFREASERIDEILDTLDSPISLRRNVLTRSRSGSRIGRPKKKEEADAETLYEYMQSLQWTEPQYDDIEKEKMLEEEEGNVDFKPLPTSIKSSASLAELPGYKRPRLSAIDKQKTQLLRLDCDRRLSIGQALDRPCENSWRSRLYTEIPAHKRQASAPSVIPSASATAVVGASRFCAADLSPRPAVQRQISRVNAALRPVTMKDVVKQIITAPLTNNADKPPDKPVDTFSLDMTSTPPDASTLLPGTGDKLRRDRGLYEEIPCSKQSDVIRWIEDSDGEDTSPQASLGLGRLTPSTTSVLSLACNTLVRSASGHSIPPPPVALPSTAPTSPSATSIAIGHTKERSASGLFLAAKDMRLQLDVSPADQSKSMLRLSASHPEYPDVPLDIVISADLRSQECQQAISSFKNLFEITLRFSP